MTKSSRITYPTHLVLPAPDMFDLLLPPVLLVTLIDSKIVRHLYEEEDE